MNKNLDVWAIQKHPKELFTALENVKTDKNHSCLRSQAMTLTWKLTVLLKASLSC